MKLGWIISRYMKNSKLKLSRENLIGKLPIHATKLLRENLTEKRLPIHARIKCQTLVLEWIRKISKNSEFFSAFDVQRMTVFRSFPAVIGRQRFVVKSSPWQMRHSILSPSAFLYSETLNSCASQPPSAAL